MTRLRPSTTMTYMETNQELMDMLNEYGFKKGPHDGDVYYCGASFFLVEAAMPELEFGATVRLVLYPMHPLGELHEKLQDFAAHRPKYAYVRTFNNPLTFRA